MLLCVLFVYLYDYVMCVLWSGICVWRCCTASKARKLACVGFLRVHLLPVEIALGAEP